MLVKHASVPFSFVAFPLLLFVPGVVAAQRTQSPTRKSIPAIAKSANGAVVSIIMSDKSGQPIVEGSGFVIGKDGSVVTNYHVIKSGASGVVKLPDGTAYGIDGIITLDPDLDLAVIKAHGKNFHTVRLGDSNRVQVGDEVVAIGNPLSMESTVSNGIVRAIRQLGQKSGGFLQITAPISPGSSGGPLFNMEGEVVGITTMYLEGGENLNFAIPINELKRLLAQFDALMRTYPFLPPLGLLPNLPLNEASTDNKTPGGGARAPSPAVTPARAFYTQFYNSGQIDGLVPTFVCFDDAPNHSQDFFTLQEEAYDLSYAKAFKMHFDVLQKAQKETVNGVSQFYTDAAQVAADAQAVQTMRSIEASEPDVRFLADDELTGFGILYGKDTEAYLRGGGRVALFGAYFKGVAPNIDVVYRWAGPGTGNSWVLDQLPSNSSIKTSKAFLRVDPTTRRYQITGIINFTDGDSTSTNAGSGTCEKVPRRPAVNP
jgi:S1-C subfamily serine protease